VKNEKIDNNKKRIDKELEELFSMKCQPWQEVYALYFLKGYFNQILLKKSVILILILGNFKKYL
jgi:hypothetical protein